MFGIILKAIRYLLIFALFFILSFIFLFIFLVRFKNTNNNLLFGRVFSYLSFKILRAKIEIRGAENLNKSCSSVIIANHQSYFDAVVFGMVIPGKTVIIGKKSLIWLPIFGWIFYLSGNLYLNRRNHFKAMSTMKNVDISIQNGSSLWIFPEGTRSHGNGLNSFKKGAFYAALHNQVPLQPIVASTLKSSLNFSKWYPGKILVEVLENIKTQGDKVDGIELFINNVHDRMKNKIIELDRELLEKPSF